MIRISRQAVLIAVGLCALVSAPLAHAGKIARVQFGECTMNCVGPQVEATPQVAQTESDAEATLAVEAPAVRTNHFGPTNELGLSRQTVVTFGPGGETQGGSMGFDHITTGLTYSLGPDIGLPEPSTFLLFATGLGALIIRRRKA